MPPPRTATKPVPYGLIVAFFVGAAIGFGVNWFARDSVLDPPASGAASVSRFEIVGGIVTLIVAAAGAWIFRLRTIQSWLRCSIVALFGYLTAMVL